MATRTLIHLPETRYTRSLSLTINETSIAIGVMEMGKVYSSYSRCVLWFWGWKPFQNDINTETNDVTVKFRLRTGLMIVKHG